MLLWYYSLVTEIRARTKVEVRKGDDVFIAGSEVLCLGKVRDEWFAEFVVQDGDGRRFVHVMLKCDDVELEH